MEFVELLSVTSLMETKRLPGPKWSQFETSETELWHDRIRNSQKKVYAHFKFRDIWKWVSASSLTDLPLTFIFVVYLFGMLKVLFHFVAVAMILLLSDDITHKPSGEKWTQRRVMTSSLYSSTFSEQSVA